ncbi:hypothetical protein GF386_02435 [Candidatus Pacearchaeota archaeon]|nr:hypothetical protein [Candidatus Pacearchaeota archaeon]MBD3283002.1 hypothetical protein [Candidatus Pacearchaeota archaeon]
MKSTAVVYMVAGVSSRFQGKIKQLTKITENKTLIEYSLDRALKAEFDKIIFIVGNKTEKAFKEKFKESYKGIPIEYVYQYFDSEKRDKPWGTADAVSLIRNKDFNLVICNGDDLYGENAFKILANHLKNKENNATLGYKIKNALPENSPGNRAVFEIDENNYVKNIQEVLSIEKTRLDKKNLKPDDLCSMNIWALNPETIELLKNYVEEFKQNHKDNRKIECFLPDALSEIIQKQKIKIKIYPFDEKTIGITHPGDELIVRKEIENNK